MLSNYLKITLRFLMRNKVYTLINITGLSVGIACCLLLTLYVNDELSFDQHHAHREQLYRVVTHFVDEGESREHPFASPPMGPAFQEEISQVAFATRLISPPGVEQNLLQVGEQVYSQEGGYLADSTLFDVFTFDWLLGEQASALNGRNKMLLSKSLAEKMYGADWSKSIGTLVSLDMGGSRSDYEVTGVYDENTYNSFVVPKFIINMASDGWGDWIQSEQHWAGQNFVATYLRLKTGANKEEVEASMNQILDKYGNEQLKMLGMEKKLSLEPLSDIYLYNDAQGSPRISYVKIIFTIAVFLLVLACINFMNLSTAKSTRRSAEVGIRKVMGAQRYNLIAQFLGETFVIVLASVVISLLLIELSLPYFNNIADKSIDLWNLSGGFLMFVLVGIILFTALLAGSYPAFFLSSFQPAHVLKGKMNIGVSSAFIRKGLVVFQFVISIALLSGVIIISRQLNYMQDKDLGFATDARIVIPLRTLEAMSGYETLKAALSQAPGVNEVSGVYYPPGSFIQNDWAFYKPGSSMDMAVNTRINSVDYGYVEVLNQKLLAGRSLSLETDPYGSNRVLVNRMTLERLGIKLEEAVGMVLSTDWQNVSRQYEIVGVLEDFHHMSLHSEILPVMYRLIEPSVEDGVLRNQTIVLSISTDQIQDNLKAMEAVWKEQLAFTPFEYHFLDEKMQQLYQGTRQDATIITVFMIIAVLISGLGLYGLSMFMAERRTKEIGIRKVLGASVTGLVANMSKEFLWLVLLAFVISIPLSYWVMDGWLTNYAYRIDITADIFVFTALLALLVAFFTVLYQSLKAAWANPVESLKDE